MMKWNEIEQTTISVREQLADLCERMLKKDTPFVVSQKQDLKTVGEYIKEDVFEIIVCGEVKKGKSSFINAIIGDDILPTDVTVSTSQIFRIVNSGVEKYELVYTDGERVPITRDQIWNYGSQTGEDAMGNSSLASDKVLDYIEVSHPIDFLPRNMIIVDTPGIGALYDAHERLTTCYLKHATAVVYILDPQAPITSQELSFIKKVLEQTPQILFVMTKMDNYDLDYVHQIVLRDKEIMKEQNVLDNAMIYPISSRILHEAAKEELDILKDDFVMNSGYEVIRERLLLMIHNTIGWYRNMKIFNMLNAYNTTVLQSVAEQSQILSQPTSAKTLMEEKKRIRDEFMEKWGPDGLIQTQIQTKIADQLTRLRNLTNDMVSRVGSIYKKFELEIEEVCNSSVLNVRERDEYCKAFPQRIQNEFGQRYKDIVLSTYENIKQILVQYYEDIQITTLPDNAEYTFDGAIEPFKTNSMSVMQYFNFARGGYYSLMFAAMITGAQLVPFATIALAVALGGHSVLDFKRGNTKNNLTKYLIDSVMLLQKKLCVDPVSETEPISLQQKIERDITQYSNEALQRIYEREKNTVEQQISLLNERINTNDDQKKVELRSITDFRKEWNVIQKDLLQTKFTLITMKKELEKEAV